MPTHRDAPWERDARKAAGRAWVAVLALAAVAGCLALVVVGARSSSAPAQAPVATPIVTGKVVALRSRRTSDGGLEAWGTADAPDGATVTIRVARTPGRWTTLVRERSFYLWVPGLVRGFIPRNVRAEVTG